MMTAIINIVAIWALAFMLRETDGPFNLISRGRNYLFRNQYIGTYFYSLLQCYFCMGAYSGAFIYLLSQSEWSISGMMLWMLAGSGIAYIINGLVERLYHE